MTPRAYALVATCTQRVGRVFVRVIETCGTCCTRHDTRDGTSCDRFVTHVIAGYATKKRAFLLRQPRAPAFGGAHRAEHVGACARDLHCFALRANVLFAALEKHAQPSLVQAQMLDPKSGELATAQRSPKADQQERAVSVVARTRAKNAHHPREILEEQRPCALLSRSECFADPALERANAWIAIGTLGAGVGVHDADRDSRTSNGAHLAPALRELREVARQARWTCGQRGELVFRTPAGERTPITFVGNPRAGGARVIEVAALRVLIESRQRVDEHEVWRCVFAPQQIRSRADRGRGAR